VPGTHSDHGARRKTDKDFVLSSVRFNDKIFEHIPSLSQAVQSEIALVTGGNIQSVNEDVLKKLIERAFNSALIARNILVDNESREILYNAVSAEILGYGPLEMLLRDDSITEIMVNGPNDIFVEKNGKIEYSTSKFIDNAQLYKIIDRIVAPIGRRVDANSPMVDARLPNGYRVNITIPPLSVRGPVITIRKFNTVPFSLEELVKMRTLSAHAAVFLKACVEARLNIIISGGAGCGKTTLLNVLASFIPAQERIITIEDIAELQLQRHHLVSLERRPPNLNGEGEVTIRQLVINALRMRPDRIIVGECRGSEALDMLQAMNTGHSGSMTTIHSNTTRDTLRRIEVMTIMAGLELPLKAIREQVSSAIDLVVHMERMKDGTRRVIKISEVQGMEGDIEVMQDIFHFKQIGVRSGKIVGQLEATGLRPNLLSKLDEAGVRIPNGIFVEAT